MTIYLYTMHNGRHTTAKHIHRFAWEYLMSWFPQLGSYQAFNNRWGAFTRFAEMLLTDFQPDDCLFDQSLLDSMPIIICSGRGAREITDKGYCSTKGIYYYGLKLHLLGFRRIGKLPHPEQILFTPASVNDVTVFKDAWSGTRDRTFGGEKFFL